MEQDRLFYHRRKQAFLADARSSASPSLKCYVLQLQRFEYFFFSDCCCPQCELSRTDQVLQYPALVSAGARWDDAVDTQLLLHFSLVLTFNFWLQ